MQPRDGAVSHPSEGETRIAFSRSYDHPADQVWAMLTEPHKMDQWWAEAETLNLSEGGRVELQWLNSDADGFQPRATGTVSALEEGRLLELDTDVFGRLRFELTPDGDATRLEFSATLPLDPAWEAKMLAGWHWRFDALAEALGGRAVDWDVWDRPTWVSLWRHYSAKFSWDAAETY